MNVEQAKNLIEEMAREFSAGNLDRVEDICTSVISGLPRDGEGRTELILVYGVLMEIRAGRGRLLRAFRVFKQYLADCAPACDAAYDEIYYNGLITTQTPPAPLERRERFFTLVQLFRDALPLQGLVAECGCFRGLSSYLLCSFLKRADSSFGGQGYRVFDSFAGLSVPQPEDAIGGSDPESLRLRQMTRPGRFAAKLEEVKTVLGAFPRVEFFPGWIPDAFPDDPGARYRFVHLDVDLYQPTRDSLLYFYPRMVPGGIIVSDDYNWPGARKAIDDFCARVNIGFKTTPHGQVYIVRGV